MDSARQINTLQWRWLHLLLHPSDLAPPTNQGYKSLPLLANPSFYSSPLGAVKWKQFWTLQVPLNARNTWFWILHSKVTTHLCIRDRFPPYCPQCQSLVPQPTNLHLRH
ncbi:hypothetical protein MAM1_0259d08853 [Mucor ambiguus]|uniref:Reverse transcriptase zinc-binding domain-containing protein n=1 Tax=Mucor ambiguus TaxID=91626 RepID=A0A0C9N429_9FUNG|nr:hypothetical protein MAM1_0259d08853 [Mucor ambiguus]